MTAHIVGALMRLARARFVRVVLEQPQDSCMFHYGPIKKALRMISADKILTFLSAFNPERVAMIPKPLRLFGTPRWLPALRRFKPKGRPEVRPGAADTYTVSSTGQVTGGAGLAASAAYTQAFGEAVCAAFRRSLDKTARDIREDKLSALEPFEDDAPEERDEVARKWFRLSP